MLSYERQQQIMELLQKRRSVTVEYLIKKLYASGATIRRDLQEMQRQGLLTRVRGGAVLIDGGNQDKPPILRAQQNTAQKERIARLAMRCIEDASTLFLDSSSTVTAFARRLESFAGQRELSVMTNGLFTIHALNELSCVTIFDCGGVIKNHSSAVGPTALSALESFHADVTFFSCCGFSLDIGTTEASEENAAVKRVMCRNAKRRILLCDSSKFDKDFFCKVCAAPDITRIITDSPPPEPYRTALGERLMY